MRCRCSALCALNCRQIGESRVVGLVGDKGARFIVYELWSWYLKDIRNLDDKGVYAAPLAP